MRAGRLTETVTIERKDGETLSPAGTSIPTWAAIATRRAEIIQASTTELLKPFGEEETRSILFRMWFAEATTADLLTHRGQHYNIREIKPIEQGRAMVLRCDKVTT